MAASRISSHEQTDHNHIVGFRSQHRPYTKPRAKGIEASSHRIFKRRHDNRIVVQQVYERLAGIGPAMTLQ